MSHKIRLINIWYSTGEHASLSNLAYRDFIWQHHRYASVEHAYQANKSGEFDPEVYEKPWRDGKKFRGNKITKTRDNWNIDLMETLIRESLNQNPIIMNLLKETKPYRLTHTQDKGVWREYFPAILERIRSEQES
jgi:hypothetical protein